MTMILFVSDILPHVPGFYLAFFGILLAVVVAASTPRISFRKKKIHVSSAQFFANLLSNPGKFHDMTNMSVDEVEELTLYLYPQYDNLYLAKRLERSPHNAFQRVVLFLIQLKCYVPFRQRHVYCGLSKSSLHALFHEMCDLILDRLDVASLPSSICPFTFDEQFEIRDGECIEIDEKKYLYIVDGIYFPVRRPVGEFKSDWYSSYKKGHRYLAVIVIDCTGRIRMIATGKPREVTEASLLHSLNPLIISNLYIWADLAYRKIHKCWTGYTLHEIETATYGEGNLLRALNLAHAVGRVRVECVFARLVVTCFPILVQSRSWQFKREAFPKVLRTCCVLYNYLHHRRPEWQYPQGHL